MFSNEQFNPARPFSGTWPNWTATWRRSSVRTYEASACNPGLVAAFEQSLDSLDKPERLIRVPLNVVRHLLLVLRRVA
jgi:hypothetical protein